MPGEGIPNIARQWWTWREASDGAAVELEDFLYVGLCLLVGRDAAVFFYGTGASVVGCKGEGFVLIEGVEHFAEIFHAASDVLSGIKWIFYAEKRGGCGHELHQALCADT